MKNSLFVRLSCFVLSLIFVMSMAVIPASAAVGADGLEHKDNYGEMNKTELLHIVGIDADALVSEPIVIEVEW